jgi:ATP-dependent DNA helicase DinG
MIKPCSQLVLEEIISETELFFCKSTPQTKFEKYGGRPYEDRPQQKTMAIAVAKAFVNSNNLCVEAPTGVGKSFAYLIPAIHYAMKNSRPVIITTETINLQEQLIEKDIPILKELLDIEFTAALAKGRSNYLCKRRLDMTTGEHQGEYLPKNSMMPEIEQINQWSNTTDDGSLADLDFNPSSGVWQCVCCENGNCFGPKCKYIRSCFYWQTRKKWEKVNLLVTNHALYLTDLKMKIEGEIEGGILPLNSGVIIDEAHQLESSAAKHMGTRISEAGLHYFLSKLFNPNKGRGLLIRPGEQAVELRQLVQNTYNHVSAFFNNVRNKLIEWDDSQKRIYKPYFVEDTLTGQLALLECNMENYMHSQNDKDYMLEIEMQIQRCRAYKKAIFEFLMMNAEESVYWVEREDNSYKKIITLNYSPLNIATILNHTLFSATVPIVLTSATLSVANTLNFYKNRVGFSGQELILDSPFDYTKQAKIHVIKEMPEQQSKNYHNSLAHYIKYYISHSHGKAFVLFTNYSSLKKIVELTRPFFEKKDITLLVQGEGISRSKMLTLFKADVNSVIFGTASFWMGVDVPGEALSNVIITKLPFSVPSEPLIEARIDKIKANGGNPFMEYSLPEAVLKFKQGIGRLIRSKMDTGIITILDNRVITKRYGKVFLDSLPPCPIVFG